MHDQKGNERLMNRREVISDSIVALKE